MWELEMHAGGGLLACSAELDLCAGDGLTLALHLSSGAQIRFNARVHCLRVITDAGKAAAWVVFTDMSPTERRAFRKWRRLVVADTGSKRIEVEVERKYRVRRCGNALSVWVSGSLDASEAEALRELVVREVETERHGILALLLDLGGVETCAEDALHTTRRWLRHLVRARASLGVLVGKSSAGLIQFHRLIREVSLSEQLVHFDTIEDALPSWKMLLDQVALHGGPAWQEGRLCV